MVQIIINKVYFIIFPSSFFICGINDKLSYVFEESSLSLLYIMEFCIMPWDFFPYTDYVIWTGYEGLEYE